MKNLQKAQFFKLFQQHPWLLLSLLAALQLAAVLAYLRLSQPNLAPATAAQEQRVADPLSDSNRPLPSLPLPSSLATLPATPPAKTATKSATKNQPPPQQNLGESAGVATAGSATGQAQTPNQAIAASQAPALTPEQQRLNQQSKAEFLNSAASFDNLVEMHVAIAEGVGSLTVSGEGAITVLDQNRNPLTTLAAGETYTVQPSSTGLSLAGANLPAVVLLEPANGGLFNLGSRTYRGRLLLANDAGRLWAVNLVNLRSYLHSVVASEVSPNWAPEALKAQAVAARSYALTYYFKPMSSLFHLGATEYYQVYSGIGREAPETSRAVDATAGEYVSYKGGIVESLYAASDDIVMEAFQGRGMSQLGALNLAEQGYSYQQILAGYYPGTGLGRMVIDP